jgi:hypothetical protein
MGFYVDSSWLLPEDIIILGTYGVPRGVLQAVRRLFGIGEAGNGDGKFGNGDWRLEIARCVTSSGLALRPPPSALRTP